METWDAIRSRRNLRAFDGRPLDDSVLERILEAARRAPSSMNQQAWDFVVVTDRSALQSLPKVWTYAGHIADSLPADRGCMWLTSFGIPADRPLTPIERPNRRPFDDVVHRERW